MMSNLQRTIDADPFRIVIDLQKEFDPVESDKVIGYRGSAIISRLDGGVVYRSFLRYLVNQGEPIADRNNAMTDTEGRARKAIQAGFPC
ncbi:hypothetical protein BZM27_40660 [Paraburkholderia steynii]|uniref:Uncharacterized protein n=1 Tax=Paraburkholderia steynii TaxID=1245441 RepID=A0A4R0XBX0_9BURK|nr:hypothetical protein BZM27_40660 [Paraburkholderia steynii]